MILRSVSTVFDQFPGLQEKFKQPSRQIPLYSVINAAVKFIPRLRKLLLGADSKTGIRVEQWRTLRTSVRTESVTVVSEEIIINHRNRANCSEGVKALEFERSVPAEERD